jgi:site-specific DNA recombinase
MIEDAKNKKYDVIVAKELSRLARNGKLSYEIQDIADRHHVHIVTLDGAINTPEGNRHMFGLYAWMYEQESQRTSDRVKATLRTRASKGLFKGSIPPYGYEVREGKLYIHNDNTPEVVKRIFHEYLAGKGTDSIARGLYSDGYPTPTQVAGKSNARSKWHGSTIKKILTNPHYTGDLVQERDTTRSVTSKVRETVSSDKLIIVPNTHEAIISKEDFEAVQAQMKVRTKNITAPKLHLFTNVAFCVDCGTGMWYRANRKGYICGGGYARHGARACCTHTVKEHVLIETILSDLQPIFEEINKEDTMQKLESEARKAHKKAAKQIEVIEKEIESLKEEKKNLIKLLANNVISREDYEDVVSSNNEKIKELSLKQSELTASLQLKDNSEQIKKAKKILNHFLHHFL